MTAWLSDGLGTGLAAGLASVVAVVLLAGCSQAGATGTDDVVSSAADVALSTPSPGPEAAARLADVPEPGTVTVVDGPFTDRAVIRDAVLADDRVTASVDVVKDVSELLALELDIAWYDAAGELVDSTRHVVDPEEAEAFHSTEGIIGLPLDVPAPGGVSATLGIPVLVNE